MGLWVALLLADAAWLTDSDAAIRGAPAVSLGPLFQCTLQETCTLAVGGPEGKSGAAGPRHCSAPPSSIHQANRILSIGDRWRDDTSAVLVVSCSASRGAGAGHCLETCGAPAHRAPLDAEQPQRGPYGAVAARNMFPVPRAVLQAVLGLDIVWRHAERLPAGRHVMVSNHATTGDLMVLYSLPRRCVHLVNASLPARVTQARPLAPSLVVLLK